ncbi:MAG: hypothetical protein WCK11_05710 [Candidatus Falkowbacteria bacterium]
MTEKKLAEAHAESSAKKKSATARKTVKSKKKMVHRTKKFSNESRSSIVPVETSKNPIVVTKKEETTINHAAGSISEALDRINLEPIQSAEPVVAQPTVQNSTPVRIEQKSFKERLDSIINEHKDSDLTITEKRDAVLDQVETEVVKNYQAQPVKVTVNAASRPTASESVISTTPTGMAKEPSFMDKLKEVEVADLEPQSINQSQFARAVFDDKGSAVKISPKTIIQPTRSLHLYRKLVITFVFLIVIFLAALAYFVWYRLDITITPKQEKIENNFVADIRNGATPGNGVVAGLVKEVSVQKQKDMVATGKNATTTGSLEGTAELINTSVSSQTLIAKTRLLSADNKLYRIKNKVVVPANGKIEVEIYADVQAAESALDEAAKFTIPGLRPALQAVIYGQTSQPIMYGESSQTAVDQTDIDKGIADVKQNLEELALAQLSPAERNQYNKFLYKLDDNSVLIKVSAEPGAAAASFTVSLTANITVVGFVDQTVKDLAKEKMNLYLGQNKSLVQFNQDELKYTLNSVDAKQGSANISISFQGEVVAKDESIVDREKLVGLSQEQIENYFKGLPEIASYQLKFTPSFIHTAPNMANRITIHLAK